MANETAEQAILNKLAQAPSFHPAGAKLFVPDWTLDPGDVVTVTAKDNVNDPDETPTSYNVPIYSMNLTWNGASRVEIESTGNQQREPLSALRRKEYQAGRRGYGQFKEIDDEFKEFETWQTQTDEVIGTYAAQFVDILGDGTNEGRLTLAETAIEQTASDATITAQAAGILLDEDGHPILDERGKYQYDPDAGDTTLTARIDVNATNITNEVTRATGAEGTLSGRITTEAGKITQIVTAVGSNGEVTAGSIILAINKTKDGSATSTTIITADAINLEGYVTASYVDATILTVNQLTSDSGYIGNIKASNINTGGNIVANGAVYGSGLYIGTNAPYTSVSDAVKSIRKDTSLASGLIGFEYTTLGAPRTWNKVNFNIADTQYYIDGVSAATNAGKASVGLNPMGYTEIQGTNYPSSQTIFTDTTGRTDASGADANLHRDITLSLDVDDNYVYMKHGSDIIARIENTGGGGGGDYYATFLNKITLDSTDITSSVQKYSIAHYSDTHVDDEAKTRVEIDASAVYQAGIEYGAGGTLGVVKTWNGDTCTFTPKIGEGDPTASVTISAVYTKGELANIDTTAQIDIKDGNTPIDSKVFTLRQVSDTSGNYVALGDLQSIFNQRYLAKISIEGGGGGGEVYAVESIDPISLTASDINTTVKYPVLHYNDPSHSTDNTISLQIDASAVYQKGQEDGAHLSILDVYRTTIDSNNTTINLFPFDKGDYDLMKRAEVTINVPVHEGVQGATLLASVDSSDTYDDWQLNDNTELSKKYGFIQITGKDGSTYNYGVDASKVYRQGMIDGSGGFTGFSYAGTAIGNVQEDHVNGEIKVQAMSGSTVLDTDTLGVYLVQGSWNSSNRKAVNIRMSDGSNTLIARTWVDAPTAPSPSHNITAGSPVARIGNTGSRVYMGSINLSSLSANSWISIPISCGDASKTFYIDIN